MKIISTSEIYSLIKQYEAPIIANACNLINKGVGIITPDKIEMPLFELEKSNRIRQTPITQSAIAAYKAGGKIRLFNLTGNHTSDNNLGPEVPYILANPGIVWINMNKICSWDPSLERIDDLMALTDLRAILEIGYVLYQLEVNHQKEQLFGNIQFIEKLTSMYTYMMYQAISKTLGASLVSETDTTAVNMKFAIAKFFLIYCLERQDDQSTDTIAYSVVKNSSTTFTGVKMFEENSMLDYDTLSGFCKTFAIAYTNRSLSLNEIYTQWVRQFGEATQLAVECPMILFYFLYCTYYNAKLGAANTRLVTRIKEHINSDLTGMMKIVYSVVR